MFANGEFKLKNSIVKDRNEFKFEVNLFDLNSILKYSYIMNKSWIVI